MIQSIPSSPFTPLPGPATSPGAHIPSASSTIPLNPLSHSTSVISRSSTISEQTKRNKAWKYEGYKDFSEWMASEDDFFIFRRFEALNARTILWMQYRIGRIEKRLLEIHQAVEACPQKSVNSSFLWDEFNMPERHALMGELSCLLHHYNQYVEAFSKIRCRPRADTRQVNNVKNWLTRKAINEDESSFIGHAADLISISARTRPPIGRWLESFPRLHLSRFFRAKHVPGLHHTSRSTSYSSNSTFDHFTNVCIILTGLVMLLAPMWWLEFVKASDTRLKIITGFLCMFTCMMSVAVNKPFEVVASTAAYAAVLMVFMQIDS